MNEYEDEDQRTDEEIAEDMEERERWEELYAAWLVSGCKCRCGQPISLADAFYYGQCDTCNLSTEVF